MQELIILGGPNGAGKTSFANEYLPSEREDLAFVNADEIARELLPSGLTGAELEIRAARMMLEEIGQLTVQRRELMIETTLSSRSYAARIPGWKSLGYSVHLIYPRLPNVEASVSRVRTRVAAGGHDIPETTIRRRFVRSLSNLENIYIPIVDEWYIWDSLEGDFQLAEAWDDGCLNV
ncbi:MAG: zeta toxin family protein [Alphaproteobacteria bacterium]|nr:zeta toxin family protein [Alphaproteobacteria bacterium]